MGAGLMGWAGGGLFFLEDCSWNQIFLQYTHYLQTNFNGTEVLVLIQVSLFSPANHALHFAFSA